MLHRFYSDVYNPYCFDADRSTHSKEREENAECYRSPWEDVVYIRDSLKVEGQVVSIDFDLEESGLVTTIYLDVDWMDEYFNIDYGKNFKRIHLKGTDDEQR